MDLNRYYLDGHIATIEDFTTPSVLDLLVKQIEKVKSICDKNSSNKEIWMSKLFIYCLHRY